MLGDHFAQLPAAVFAEPLGGVVTNVAQKWGAQKRQADLDQRTLPVAQVVQRVGMRPGG